MDCKETLQLLDACMDGELDLIKTLEVEAHIQDCPDCAREQSQRQELRSAFRSAASTLYYRAPAAVSRRALRAVAAEGKPVRYVPRQGGFAAAFAFAAVVGIAAFIVPRLLPTASQDGMVNEVVGDHVRSLMAAHLTDVASSDHHTVKPWFSGKLDFAPPVIDLADQGFKLIGGRLDELQERPVAALVYGHGKHLINLFISPAATGQKRSEEVEETTRRGYFIFSWTNGNFDYYAVSDMSEEELRRFAKLLQQK